MLARLDEAIKAVCPIHGVAGTQGNVRIDYKPEATAQQRTDAQAVLAAFDWSQAADDAWERGQEPDLRDLLDQADAAIAAINTYLTNADAATQTQVRAEVKAIDQRQKRIIQALKRLIQRAWRT